MLDCSGTVSYFVMSEKPLPVPALQRDEVPAIKESKRRGKTAWERLNAEDD
jgi:hypothetical protein